MIEIHHFKNQQLAKAYMQGVHDITEWLLKPSKREATNFDRITASPEVLADILYRESSGEWARWCKGHICKSSCKECFIDWLKQKAEDPANE